MRADYTCPDCHYTKELTFTAAQGPGTVRCPQCGALMTWKPTPTAFILKGDGWTRKEGPQ